MAGVSEKTGAFAPGFLRGFAAKTRPYRAAYRTNGSGYADPDRRPHLWVVERSPITHVQKIKTPLMLIEGEADLRTPPAAGGEQMFRALKYLKKPVVMVRFPGESHELSRSGKPTHRVERLQHIVAWFDKYLLGQEIHTYDVR